MKHSTEKLKDKNSPSEIRAIQLLNSDLNRSYPGIDFSPAAGRARIVCAAMRQCNNPFQLCRETSRIVRMVHDSNSSRVACSITWALRKIADTSEKKRPAIFTPQRLTA